MKKRKVLAVLCLYLAVLLFVLPPAEGTAFASADYQIAAYYKDQNIISDEAYFGVWDSESGVWQTEPKLNYVAFSELHAVEEAVQGGNYEAAKEAYRTYHRNKFALFEKTMYGDGSAKQYAEYLMAKNNIVIPSSDFRPMTVMTAPENWGYIEVDYTAGLSAVRGSSDKNRSFMLMALVKDRDVIQIASREAAVELRPCVEAVVNGKVRSFYPTDDAYISAGNNSNTGFGTDEMLKVAESMSSNKYPKDPVDEGTFRTYLKFNFDINQGDTVESAVLRLYGCNSGGTAKDMILFSVPETAWTETGIRWTSGGGISHYVYSFSGMEGPSWYLYDAVNHYQRVEDDPVRLSFLYNTLGYYQTSGDPEAMYTIARLITHYIMLRPVPPKWSYNLDLGNRSTVCSELLRYLVDSDAVPTDVYIGLVKFVAFLGEELFDESHFDPSGNWGLYETNGFLCVWGHLDELTSADLWLDKITERYALMFNTNIFDDGSSVEVALGYAMQTAYDYVSIGEKLEAMNKEKDAITFPQDFMEKLHALCRYIMNITGPNFADHQQGDSVSYAGTTRGLLEQYGRYFDDPELLWAGTNGREGREPDYTSVLYPAGAKMAMRSGWSNDSLYLHLNADSAMNDHGHADDLSVVLFAYGNYLLVDPLYYSYSQDPYRIWLISTRAHNTVMINDRNQAEQTGQGTMENWKSNNVYDYISAGTTTGTDAGHTRKVLFVKNKFFIVTDYLEPYVELPNGYQYEQLWHFLPDADITMNDESLVIETNYDDANVKVIPVGIDDYTAVNDRTEGQTGIKDGYFSNAGGNVSDAAYASYVKRGIQGATTFNTVLFPTNADNQYDVSVRTLATDLQDNEAAAFKIRYQKQGDNVPIIGVYYNLLDLAQKSEREVDQYSTDGQLLYAEKEGTAFSTVVLHNGTHVRNSITNKELLKSRTVIEDIAVRWMSSSVYIDAENLTNLEDLTILAEQSGGTRVYLNEEEIPFKRQGAYIYFGDEPIIPDASEAGYTPPSITRPFNTHGSVGGGGSSVQLPTKPDASQKPVQAFADVEVTRWSYKFIHALAEKGIIQGTDSGLFEPERSVTREEFLKMLFEALSIPITERERAEFSDVSEGAWYEPYVAEAVRLGVVTGVAPDVFGVGVSISRQDMAVMINRVVDHLQLHWGDGEMVNFVDDEEISDYARDAVTRLVQSNMMTGDDSQCFRPKHSATREQAAKVIDLLMKWKSQN